MRFEIGPGGMLLILLGLAGLSAAVFGLGLVAGHEMAAPEPGSQPVVAAYPLPPSAPASAPSESAEASAPAPAAPNAATETASPSEAVGAASTTAAANNPPAAPAAASVSHVKALAPAPVAGASALRKTAGSSTAVASRSPRTNAAATEPDEDLSTGAAVAPPSGSASAPAETADTGTDEGDEEAPAPAPAAPPHRKLAAVTPPAPRSSSGPYSVQIDAMMDRAGAQQMAQKIRAKGFEPFIVPTMVDGKTWYRLRVGHYATPEQAQAAESRLHQEFNDTPSGN
jgi:DedD protein